MSESAKPLNLFDKLNEIRVMVRFMGFAIEALGEYSVRMGDDEQYGCHLLFNHIDNEIKTAEEIAEEFFKAQKGGNS